jgi:hypothetical protein
MTAIEWLLVRINDEYLYKYYSKDIQQAKEIEKQQLEKVFKDAFVYGLDWNQKEISFNEYYNETFKK